MGTYVSSKKWINTEQAELRRVYPWQNPRLALAVIPPNTPAITSICIRMPLSVRLLLWADLWCVLLSPWDTCIDQFNTRRRPGEPLFGEMSPRLCSLGQITIRENKEPAFHIRSISSGGRMLQSLQTVVFLFFLVIHALGGKRRLCVDWHDYGYC